MLQFFGQLMKLPLEAFVYSMEMLVQTMRGIQQIAYQGIDMVASELTQPVVDAPSTESDLTTDVTAGANITTGAVENSLEIGLQTSQEEGEKMADRDLHGDDELKLVRYKILFVKRDYEHAFQEKEELVHENINESDYTGWKIAEFIQRLDRERIPDAWLKKNYPRPAREGDTINSLDEDDKKYLRVYFEVLQRYPREKFHHEEEQIKVLKDIRDRLRDKVDVEKDQVELLRQVGEDIREKLDRKVEVEERQVVVLEEVRDRIGRGQP